MLGERLRADERERAEVREERDRREYGRKGLAQLLPIDLGGYGLTILMDFHSTSQKAEMKFLPLLKFRAGPRHAAPKLSIDR